MRKMNEEEISDLLANFGWATLCMVDAAGSPYAIEFSYFLDHGDICSLVHPRGRASHCLAANPKVCVKICDSDRQCRNYQAISGFGCAAFEKLTDPQQVAWAWDCLESQLKLKSGEYRIYKDRYLESGKALPLLRIMVDKYTGVTSRHNANTEKSGEEPKDALE